MSRVHTVVGCAHDWYEAAGLLLKKDSWLPNNGWLYPV